MSVIIMCPTCMVCSSRGEVAVTMEEYNRLMTGALISDHTFPDMTADVREMLISGIHPECFDEMVGDEE